MPFRGAPCALLRPKAEASFEYIIKFPCIIKIALEKYSLESYLERKFIRNIYVHRDEVT